MHNYRILPAVGASVLVNSTSTDYCCFSKLLSGRAKAQPLPPSPACDRAGVKADSCWQTVHDHRSLRLAGVFGTTPCLPQLRSCGRTFTARSRSQMMKPCTCLTFDTLTEPLCAMAKGHPLDRPWSKGMCSRMNMSWLWPMLSLGRPRPLRAGLSFRLGLYP